jgi:hypothetical protein
MYVFLLFVLILILAIILIFLNLYRGGIKYGGEVHNKQLTYKILYNKEYAREAYYYLYNRLNKLGWKEDQNNKKYVNFTFSLLNNSDHIFADLKYALNGHKSISYKDCLYKNMKNVSHIPYTEELSTYKWCGDIIIVKEVLSCGQKGIYVVAEEKEFLKLKSKLINIRAIVSKYIQNPLLFEGKKFHLRIMVIVFIYRQRDDINKLIKKILYLKNRILVLTSEKKYITHNKYYYLDPKITITSGMYTNKLIYFPDIEKYYSAKFIDKCKKSIDSAINSISLDSISLYPEQKAGFFIYGADIMLDDTGHAWILELNSKPQHVINAPPKIVKEHMSYNRIKLIRQIIEFRNHYFAELFKFILDDIVLPYFKYLYS